MNSYQIQSLIFVNKFHNFMHKYSCIIIDDNELDRLIVESYVRKFDQFSILGVFSNVLDAIGDINSNPPDIFFLDIDMPEMSGLQFRRIMKDIPVCVFITSHAEHAVEGFEVEALDFIVKPVDLERFTLSINRICDYLDLRIKAIKPELDNESVFLKEGYGKVKIVINDILYIEALKDLTRIVTIDKQYCVSSSFGNLLNESAFRSFLRVHRSFAVSKKYIHKIQSQKIELKNGVSIPLGRSYKGILNLY